MNAEEAAEKPVARCADEMLVFHRQRWKMAVAAILITVGSELLAKWWKISFLPPVGCLIVIGAIVLPHVLQMHRFLSSLLCGYCSQPVGRFTTRRDSHGAGRMILICKHCGKETMTNCVYPHRNSPPQKVESGS